jgi:quinol monooxygenase YgiN
MGDQVSWLLELAVKPGRLDELRAVVDEMVESTRAEPGALVYEWFVADDGATVDVYERYADSGAALAHLATFGQTFAGRLLSTADVTRWTVFGSPSDEARRAMDRSGASYMGSLAGFAR